MPGATALKRADLSILLTSDRAIQKINREWRGKDRATDVLSFPLKEAKELRRLGRRALQPGLPRWELGDIVISLPRAKAQSKKHGLTLREELDLLLVHGILHLLWLDHERSPREERKMRALERELTGGMGLLSAGG